MPDSPNLSPVSCETWLQLVFGQRVTRADSHPFRTNYRVTDEARIVAHMTRCCREFKALSKRFTLRQLYKGIWFLMGCNFEMGAYLANPAIDLQARLDLARAMLHPYSNFVAGSRVHVMENGFDMWLGMLCSWFWDAHLQRLKRAELDAAIERDEEADSDTDSPRARFYARSDPQGDMDEQLANFGLTWDDLETEYSKIEISYDELEPAEQTVADAILETLTQILYLEDPRCVQYALHGLNHHDHPRRAEVVRGFIDRHKSEWTPQGLAWVESCRDGAAM